MRGHFRHRDPRQCGETRRQNSSLYERVHAGDLLIEKDLALYASSRLSPERAGVVPTDRLTVAAIG